MEHYTDHHQPSSLAVAPLRQAVPSASYIGFEQTGLRYGYDMAEETESGNIVEYLRILGRHKKFIFVTAFVFMILGYVVGLPITPVYRAKTLVEVLSINGDFLGMKHSSPISDSDNSEDTSEEETQAGLLQSETLIQHVYEKLDPDWGSLQHKNPTPRPKWMQMLHIPSFSKRTQREILLDKATSSLKVRMTGRTRLLEITADSTNAQFGAEFLNTLTREFILHNIQARMGDNQRTGEWLQREIDDARLKLRLSEDALQKYAGESGLVFTADDSNIETEKLQQIQQSLSDATADRVVKQSRFELAKSSSPQSLADVLNDLGLRDTAEKLRDVTGQVADLAAVFNSDYPKLQRLRAERTTLQETYNSQRDDILNRIGTDYEAASRREKLLSAAYAEQVKRVGGMGEKAVQYNILKREVDGNRQLYDMMLQQTKQASVATALHASNVRVVDEASVPMKPIFPNFPIDMAAAFVIGLTFSIGFVFVREKADRTLQDPGESHLLTKLPDLGTIPSASDVHKKQRGYAPPGAKTAVADRRNGISPSRGARHLPTPTLQGGMHLIWTQETSVVADAFRSVVTSILVSMDLRQSSRVFVLTSANAAEGKTTVTSNVAISMAEIGRNVLIIDSDLRRPRMNKIFDLENDVGLTELLKMNQIPETKYADFIQRTNIPNLDVLTSGTPTGAATNLLYSPNMAQLIGDLRKQYDFILIDTPPMHMPDARIVSRLCDGVILVVRSGRTTRDALIAVEHRFREDRIKVLGTILNDWNPKYSRSGYYYGKYYGGGQSNYDVKVHSV